MKGIGERFSRGAAEGASGPGSSSKLKTLALGLCFASVVGFTVSFSVATAYRNASTDRQTEVQVVTMEGDAWGLHGVFGAAVDGVPVERLLPAVAGIEAEITSSRRTIGRLGQTREVEDFLAMAEAYRKAIRNDFTVLLSGDRRSANALYRAQNAGLFQDFLALSARTKSELDNSATAAEQRGFAVTTGVLLLSSFILYLLTRRLSNLRKTRAINETQRAEQQRFRALVDRSPDMITVFAPDGTIEYDSPSVERMLGWSSATRVGSKSEGSVHPDDREVMDGLLVDLAANPGESRTLETRVRHGDGEYRWVEATLTNLSRDPAVGAHVANYRIIDERKRAENLRQQLMSRVISAQEDERKRIAADIHDDSVQVMAAVQLRLHSLARTKGEAERQKALDYLEETVRLSITRLRRLMFELRPAALDRDGLASAIETNLQMMAGETGIEPSIHWSLASEPPLESRVILYRIVQEALANVRKHAHAKHLSVSVEGSDDGILVRVADDGIGFAGPWENKPDHIGLAAMRERAEGISGWLRIESDPGRGTTVHVWAPLPQPVDSAMQHAGVA